MEYLPLLLIVAGVCAGLWLPGWSIVVLTVAGIGSMLVIRFAKDPKTGLLRFDTMLIMWLLNFFLPMWVAILAGHLSRFRRPRPALCEGRGFFFPPHSPCTIADYGI